MLYRKVEKKIKKWINDGNDALLITGARQIGKTFIIEKMLKETNSDYVVFNLIENPDIINVLKSVDSNNIKTFLERLTIISSHKFIKGKTIIFFDEIQEFKEIVTKIKFLVQDGSFKYIFSGSLLGVELNNIKSAPVGYLSTINMYPIDFEEFLYALKIKEETINLLKDSFDRKKTVDEFIHKKMLEAFKIYLLVGGMPEAVQKYIDEGDFNEVSYIHNKIIEQYKLDFTKYENNNKLKLYKIYDLIPSELADKNRRYIFNDIEPHFKFNRYENSFNWLIDAGVCIPTFNVQEPRLPLKINKKSNLFKLFLSDIGMLTTLYGNTTKLAILNGDNALNCGAIYENVIAQELYAHGFDSYYFRSHKQGEVDFVIEDKDCIIPIEVKSGKDYKIHNALNNILNNKDYGIKTAYVLSNNNLSHTDKIIYIPVYMIMFLHKNDEILPKILIDLSNIV